MDNENSATISGFMADLTQLTNILASISHDSHFWSCPRNLPNGARQIIVRYTNPIYPGLPNDLSFGFPVLHEPILFYPARETTYACLSPYVAHPIQTGLYLEHGTLKEDAWKTGTSFGLLFARNYGDVCRSQFVSNLITWETARAFKSENLCNQRYS
jgi:hypothetical protein